MADIDAYLTGTSDDLSSDSSNRGPVNEQEAALQNRVVMDDSSVFFSGPVPIVPFLPVTWVRTNLASTRVTFNAITKRLSAANLDDALNPSNYAVGGPEFNTVVAAVAVAGDPYSVDLYHSSALIPGTWTLSVTNVAGEDPFDTLEVPNELTLQIADYSTQGPLSGGATNLDICNVLLKFFNPALRGSNWDDVICAIAAGDQINWDNARKAFNQLYLSSASGKYLDRKVGDIGQERPFNVGMSDEVLRRLAVIINSDKLTQEAILEVLEIFYGKDAVTASITTDGIAPYRLEDQDQLRIFIDSEEDVIVTFESAEFAQIGQATALEVAAVITRAFLNIGSQAVAVAVTDTLTGASKVQIYSGSRGLGSSIQIIGGRAQTQLLFPQSLFEETGSSPFATWEIIESPDNIGRMRFTETTGIYDLNVVQEGDLAYIYGAEFEASANNGVFEIKEVSVSYDPTLTQWFEVENIEGDLAGVEQILFQGLMFFRPVVRTIYDVSRRVIVAQAENEIAIQIPATTLAVTRGPGTGAYLNVADSLPPGLESPNNIQRRGSTATVSVEGEHGLEVGDLVMIDDVVPEPVFEAGAWIVQTDVGDGVSNTPSTDFVANVAVGETEKWKRTSASEAGTYEGVYSRAVTTPEGVVLIVGGETRVAGVSTNIPNPVAFQVTSSVDDDGGRQVEYEWDDLVTLVHTIGRRDFGVSVVDDGRVLVTGGHDSTDVLVVTPTDAWDMITYVVSPPASEMVSGVMPVVRGAHAQVSMSDGNILVSGGFSTTWDNPLDTADIMDPDDFTWTSASPMLETREQHALVSISGDRVLAIGGRKSLADPFDIDGTCMNLCEVYDIGGDSWSYTGNTTIARFGFGAIALPDGRVLVVGGTGYNPTQSVEALPLKSCEVYDPSTGLWAAVPDMSVARAFASANYIESMNAVVVTSDSEVIEYLDVDTMTWSRSVAAIDPLSRSTAAVAGDDVLLVAGGLDLDTDSTVKQNYIVLPNEETFWEGGLNVMARVATTPSVNSFTFETPEYVGWTAALNPTITPVAAPAAIEGVPGPFMFDPVTGIPVTGIEDDLVSMLDADQRYSSIELVDATDFPDEEGWLVFNFGRSDQVGPVKYLGRLSTTELALDASFLFPYEVDVGAKVCLLSGRVPFEPAPGTLPGALYMTDSVAGRIAAEAALDDTIAAGVEVNKTIIYPGDRGLAGEGLGDKGEKKSDEVWVWGQ